MNSSYNYWAWKEADIENCPVTSMKDEKKERDGWWCEEKEMTIVEQSSYMVFKLTEAFLIIFDSSFPGPVWEHFVSNCCPPRSRKNEKSSCPCNSSHYIPLCRIVALPFACKNQMFATTVWIPIWMNEHSKKFRNVAVFFLRKLRNSPCLCWISKPQFLLWKWSDKYSMCTRMSSVK